MKESICERTGINQLEIVIAFRIKYQQHINCILIYLSASRYLTDYFYSYCFGLVPISPSVFGKWTKLQAANLVESNSFLCCKWEHRGTSHISSLVWQKRLCLVSVPFTGPSHSPFTDFDWLFSYCWVILKCFSVFMVFDYWSLFSRS